MTTKIVITGAGSAIGLAIFHELLRLHPGGFFIVQCFKHPEGLEAVKEKSGGGCEIHVHSVDFSSADALDGFLEHIRDTDILINAAAVTKTGALPHLADADVLDMIRVNIEAFTRICQAVIPAMTVKRKGCIVNISSAAASRGNRGQTVYAGTKGYMEAFTRALAAEYGAKGIRANCVAPGPIQAGTMNELLAHAPEQVKESIVSKRLGIPEDVAHAAAFLCSDKASFINGKTIGVDGGFMRGI
ncbi:MAG: SDR family oxidoreductase [bacterium]|nr:SDR family oxidoreductase [bacterium]